MLTDADRTPDSEVTTAFLPADVLREAVCAVLELRTNVDVSAGIADAGAADLSGWRLDGLGIDSLMIAEIVVELEQRLDTFLELTAGSRMETLADLRHALQPADTG